MHTAHRTYPRPHCVVWRNLQISQSNHSVERHWSGNMRKKHSIRPMFMSKRNVDLNTHTHTSWSKSSRRGKSKKEFPCIQEPRVSVWEKEREAMKVFVGCSLYCLFLWSSPCKRPVNSNVQRSGHWKCIWRLTMRMRCLSCLKLKFDIHLFSAY